jgi:aminoglycoside phosphotransferase family enzyme/predicted kinase
LQEQVFAFLGDPATHGANETVQRIDTAGAVVFLAGSEAYKVKRAVRFPFMDLSTLELRRAACEAEIEINRVNAPGVYLGVVAIVRRAGCLAIGGEGEVIEWATRMRRFDERATLDRLIERGDLDDALVDRLALAIRRSHIRAPLRDAAAATRSLETYLDQNEAAFARWPHLFPPAEARQLIADCRLAFAVLRPLLIARGALGLVRRCHGDLHARNIAIIKGEPALFDAIEFSDAIASGDVLYDLAFLLMDLEERGRRDAANRLINRYLAPEPPAALEGLAALPFFLSLRAAIRAKVEAAGAERLSGEGRAAAEALARRYFVDARGFLRHQPARLVAIGGLSGAGKSALAGRIAARLGRSPGALWLRSDVERKAAAGVEETTRLPDSAYTDEARRAIYAVIGDKARRALRAGHSVILDATFASGNEREGAAGIAAEVGCGFDGLWIDVPLAERALRVAARPRGASDADASVAIAQRGEPLAQKGWTAIDGSGTLDETVLRTAARLKL